MVWWEVGRINYYQFDLTHTKYLGAAGIVLNFYYIHILAYLPYLLL